MFVRIGVALAIGLGTIAFLGYYWTQQKLSDDRKQRAVEYERSISPERCAEYRKAAESYGQFPDNNYAKSKALEAGVGVTNCERAGR